MSAVAILARPIPAEPVTAPVAYFQKGVPSNLILGAFFAITLPLAAFITLDNTQLLLWVYIWLFGMTHFIVTFTIYMNRAQLLSILAAWLAKSTCLFSRLPVAIFIGFDLIHVFRVRVIFASFAALFLRRDSTG